MSSKTRTVVAIIIVAVFIFGFLVPLILSVVAPKPAFAKTAEELRKELNSSRQVTQSLREKIDGLTSRRDDVLEQKRQLDIEIDGLNKNIDIITREIDVQEQQILEKEDEIAELEEDIAFSSEQLKQRLRIMYEKGDLTYIDILFSSTSLSDMLLRADMIKQLVGHDKQLIADLKAKKDRVKEAKESIESQQREKEKMRAMLADEKAAVIVKTAESEALIDQLESDTEEAKKMLAQREAEESAMLSAISSSSYVPDRTYSGGVLGWPAPISGTITSRFGNRIFRGVSNYHTGVDIAVPMGTHVLAAEAGVVIEARWYNDYGMCVIINHGSISTLYAHNSAFNVSAGQQVKKGDVIAFAGSTGNSTGPHIHFGVIDNSKSGRFYLDPMLYL